MICIPIIFPDHETRWVLVELQGTLHNSDGGELNSKILGSIAWNNGIPSLTIGNHRCVGKVVKLRNPLAILCKSFAEDPIELIRKEYLVKAVVREKLLFSERPHPLLQFYVLWKQMTYHLKSYLRVQCHHTLRFLSGKEVSALLPYPFLQFDCYVIGKIENTHLHYSLE